MEFSMGLWDWIKIKRNIFLTCGSDGLIRLYHLLQKLPIMQWEPTHSNSSLKAMTALNSITSVKFSPIRPMVFAAASQEGVVYIFDLVKDTVSPVLVLEPFLQSKSKSETGNSKNSNNLPAKSKTSLNNVSFNPKQRDLISACDYWGNIHIWKLSWNLANIQPGEQAQLNKLGHSEF